MYGYSGGGGYGGYGAYGGGYDPFSVQNLWGPMAQTMQRNTDYNMNQLAEQFGASGNRYSSALMQEQRKGLSESAQDMNQLYSQLQYEDATRSWDRQQQMMKDAFGMGMQDRQMTNQDLDRAYQHWMWQQEGMLDMISKFLGGGYKEDQVVTPGSPDKSWVEEWGPVIAAVISAWG